MRELTPDWATTAKALSKSNKLEISSDGMKVSSLCPGVTLWAETVLELHIPRWSFKWSIWGRATRRSIRIYFSFRGCSKIFDYLSKFYESSLSLALERVQRRQVRSASKQVLSLKLKEGLNLEGELFPSSRCSNVASKWKRMILIRGRIWVQTKTSARFIRRRLNICIWLSPRLHLRWYFC